MSAAKQKKDAELTPEELAKQECEPLPDREVMSTIGLDPQPVPSVDGDVLFPTDPNPKGVA